MHTLCRGAGTGTTSTTLGTQYVRLPVVPRIAQRFQSFPLGWQGSDGFRGHVFLSSDNSTVVLAIKGTTLQGPTSKEDKFNDNLYAHRPPLPSLSHPVQALLMLLRTCGHHLDVQDRLRLLRPPLALR